LYRRPDGTWQARVRYTDPVTGERRRASFYGPTAKAARAEMKKALDRIDAGSPVKDASATVGGWLYHWRATTLAASDRKEFTRELYANLSRKHLEPAPFGVITLDRLRPKPTGLQFVVLGVWLGWSAMATIAKPPMSSGFE
jgi:integrase